VVRPEDQLTVLKALGEIVKAFCALVADFFRSLVCKHEWTFVANLYGDQINLFNGRSLWMCKHCPKSRVGRELYYGDRAVPHKKGPPGGESGAF
jgi:hypothetical protein